MAVGTAYKLGKHGDALWTRETAAKIRIEIETVVRDLPEGEVVAIDARGVKVFDFSFANELFGRLIHDLPQMAPSKFIVVERLTGYARENLEKALESIGLAILERRDGKLSLLGKKGAADEDTFQAIARHTKPVSAAVLAEELGTNPTAMNERLTKLTRLGVIRRQKVASPAGREQYAYQAPR